MENLLLLLWACLCGREFVSANFSSNKLSHTTESHCALLLIMWSIRPWFIFVSHFYYFHKKCTKFQWCMSVLTVCSNGFVCVRRWWAAKYRTVVVRNPMIRSYLVDIAFGRTAWDFDIMIVSMLMDFAYLSGSIFASMTLNNNKLWRAFKSNCACFFNDVERLSLVYFRSVF